MAAVTRSSSPGPQLNAGVVFHGATCDDYETMLRLVGDRPIRVTYDQGTMEIFIPSFGHEDDAHLLGRMIEILTDTVLLAARERPAHGRKTTTRSEHGSGAPRRKALEWLLHRSHMAMKNVAVLWFSLVEPPRE